MTDNRDRGYPALVLAAATAAGLLTGAPSAAAQDGSRTYLSTGTLGDIQENETPSPGKVHLSGNAGFATADYSRGAFDNVPEDLDEIALMAGAAATFELSDRPVGWFRGLTLTVGTDQAWADQVQPTDSDVSDWYESNFYTGVAAELGPGWRAGLTYAAFTSPNDVSPTSEEITLAAGYAGPNVLGDLGPQVKLTTPIDGGDGLYTELGIAPEYEFRQGSAYPLSVTVPVRLGIGFDDFYGDDAGTAGYVSAGVTGSVPLPFIPSDYGNWTLDAGLDVIIREDDLDDAGGPFDDGGTVVPIGTLQVGFAY